MAIAASSRIPSFVFYVRLGSPVLQVVALSARLDEISLPPPCAAARRPGWATPSPKPKKNSAFRRKIEGNRSPRRTALKPPGKAPCRNYVLRASWSGLIFRLLPRWPVARKGKDLRSKP
jgi:hypothetical protein